MAERVLSARTRRRLKQRVSQHLTRVVGPLEHTASRQQGEVQTASENSSQLDEDNPEYFMDDISSDDFSSRYNSTDFSSSDSDISLSSSDETSDYDSSCTTSSGDEEVCHSSDQLQLSLYSQSELSQHSFSVAMMSLAQRHNLTYACQADILHLFSTVLPTPNSVPSSALTLRKHFVEFESTTIIHRFCGNCIAQLGPQDSSRCCKPECVSSMVPVSTFIEIPLDKQLIDKFKDPDFGKMLRYRFVRESANEVFGDIFDGEMYKKVSMLSADCHNVSLSLNYDGAPVFKSSSMQIWPVQMFINELPPHLRLSRHYLLLGGLWCSARKPPTLTFLKPIMSMLNKLATEGIQIETARGPFNCKAILLYCLADLPAKAALLNCNQYNGQFGCNTCEHEGVQVVVGRGSTRVYPYQQVQMRTHAKHLTYVHKAENLGIIEKGVKGKSVLHLLPHFDIVEGCPVDYMHCVLLGVTRKLLSLWFDPKYHREQWYVGSKGNFRLVDSRLASIHPPKCVNRPPRSITTRSHWKAAECRTFLLYYIPAVLPDILPDDYLLHALLLSKAIRLLLTDHVTTRDIEVSQELLDLFWMHMEMLYGLEHCGINVHLLCHLPFFVKCYGPLWTHSAFAFEDGIGYLVNRCHATHDIAHQIVSSFLLQWKIHLQKKGLLSIHTTPPQLAFFLKQLDESTRSVVQELTEGIYAIGKPKPMALTKEEVAAISKLSNQQTYSDVLFHQTVKVYGKVIVSKYRSTRRTTKRNSYTVGFTTSQIPNQLLYGTVFKLLTLNASGEDPFFVALIKPLNVQYCTHLNTLHCPSDTNRHRTHLFSDFLSIQFEKRELLAIHMDEIQLLCFDVSTTVCKLLTVLVNEKEKDV